MGLDEESGLGHARKVGPARAEDANDWIACGWCTCLLLFIGDIATFSAWIAMDRQDSLFIVSCVLMACWIFLACALKNEEAKKRRTLTVAVVPPAVAHPVVVHPVVAQPVVVQAVAIP